MTSILSANDLSKSFSRDPLFTGLSIALEEGERAVLIGANGSGKTTLLRILAGLEESDSGTVALRRNCTRKIVAQDAVLARGQTAEEVLLNYLSELPEVERSARASRWLRRAQIDPQQTVAGLSGGKAKQLALTCALAAESDLLFLDEPTNHLDVDLVLMLEQELQSRQGATLLVSHDRYFIERVAQRVIEIDRRYPAGYLSARGKYSDFLEQRANEFAAREAQQASLSNKVRREVEWLRRGPKARTTKSKGRIDAAHEMIAELEGMGTSEKKLSFDFATSERQSKELMRLDRLGFEIGGRKLFSELSLVFSPGMRVGIVGPNGCGKSSLMRLMAGEITKDTLPETAKITGKASPAYGLRIRYFDQHRRALDKDLTIRKTLCPDGDAVVFNDKQIHVSGWARRFKFEPNQLGALVGSLSGGEQARLLLAKFMIEPADLLLLDEPTNDLDIQTLELLEEALMEFHGAVVLISHDRYFISKLATTILGFDGQGQAELFAEYEQWESNRSSVKLNQNNAGSSRRSEDSDNSRNPEKKPNRKALTFAERLELDGIEKKILKAEAQHQATQEQLETTATSSDHVKLTQLSTALAEQENEVEQLYARWAELERKAKG